MMVVFSQRNLMIFLLVILAVSCLIASEDAIAVDFDPFGPDETNMLSLPEDATDEGPIIPRIEFNNNEISMAFQIISDATGWSIFPTVEVSRAKVSLWAKDITAKELLDTVITMAGFIYHKQENVISVMTYDEYMRHYGLAKKIIPLTYADAASVVTVIKPFLTKLGKSVVHKKTNTIVLFESDANLEIIVDVIEKLDIPAEIEMGLEVIDLKYTDAEVLAETLQKIFSDEKSQDNIKSIHKEKEPLDDSNERIVKPEVSGEDVLLTPQAQVGIYSIGRANQLIIKAFQNDIEKLKKLIEKLDTYVEPTTKSYHFTYVDATEVYTGLDRILDISGRFRTRGRTGGQSSQDSDRRGGIILVEKTNSILLTGPPSVHRIMTNIVESTDVSATYKEGMIRSYKLENADVDEVADAIRELIQSEDEQKGKSGEVKFSKESVGGDVKTPDLVDVAETEEFIPQIETRVAVSKSTNSVIVRATARQHRELEKLIEELDKRRKQVLIKAMIVEVATSDNLDFGVELNHAGESILAFTSFGLSIIDPVSGARDVIVSPGGTAAVLKPNKVQAILQAIQSNGNARITSAPQILVNDNAIGLINSVAEEPITQINASETVATTSFAGFVEAGTQFAITPHISENDYLRIEYEITLNSFGTRSADSSIPPPRSTTSIRSEAMVPNEFTIIVGGLQNVDESESVDKLPLLGDIPLIGYAFQKTTIRKQYKTTYLFVTPSIMKEDDFSDLKDVSRKVRQEVENNAHSQTTHDSETRDTK